MTARTETLPYGVGRFTAGWWLLLAVLAAVVGWGVYAYSRQLAEGLAVTGLRDIGSMAGAAWGLYIAFDIYFVGVSFAGISTAALIRPLRLEHLKPVSRMAELLTVISLILAACSVLPDLGLPVRGIVNLFRYARPQSPFFGTFTLVVAGYLFASLVYFYLDGRRDAALLARVPGPLQGFYRAWAAGYRDTPEERVRHHRASLWLAIASLDGMLLVLVLAYLYFMAAELLTMIYAPPEVEARVTWALLRGEYAWLYWSSAGFLVLAAAALAVGWMRELFGLRLPAFRPWAAWVVALVLGSIFLVGVVGGNFLRRGRGQLPAPGRVDGGAGDVARPGPPASVQPELGRKRGGEWGAGEPGGGGQAAAHRGPLPDPRHAPPIPRGELRAHLGGVQRRPWLFALGTLLYALFTRVFPIMELPGEEG
ncbi:MAG: hypothetical protein N0A24_08985 [Armatimonadetes bacterium]|nr:hypothetical protein [Armatimonadota bacterium]MDW8154324.1 hypothetical protein [Armatimonadota bacterium]